MPNTISRVSDVEFELNIEATADDLAPGLQKAIRAQRGRTTMKGFRPGKVPASLVEKIYGKALAYGVADEHVQRTYRTEVIDSGEYDVLGSPTITELEYEYGQDLKATVRFGVRPTFELADLSDARVSRLAHVVTDEEVDEEIERIREREAELTTVDGPTEKHHLVSVDLQRIDAESGTPVVGEKREDVTFFLDNEELPESTRKALVGLKSGDAARVSLVQTADGEEATFDATIKEIKHRDLADFDDAFVETLTNGEIKEVDAFRADLRTRMQQSIDRTAREMMEGELVKTVLDRHDFDVPESVVDMVLDGRLEDFRKQLGDKLPEGFDENGFRDAGRDEATRQARWMFIRDHVTAEQELEVTEDDRLAYFEEMAAGQGMPADFLAKYYQSMPQLMKQVDERLQTTKVLDHLATLVQINELDRDAYAAEREKQDEAHDH